MFANRDAQSTLRLQQAQLELETNDTAQDATQFFGKGRFVSDCFKKSKASVRACEAE